MFNILGNNKPELSKLIPNGFIDIHSHILPGIDDGAKNIKDSKELINGMKELGFSKIIGTPHTYPGLYENSNHSIKNSFHKVENLIKNIKIGYASEYFIDYSIVEKSEKKSLLCLSDNYVLIEMGFLSEHSNLHDIIFQIQINNYIPVLAHPERYGFIYNDFKKYYKLKDLGCLFQINLLSVTGYYGNKTKDMSEKLIENDLIDFAGSDIHNINHIRMFSKKVKIKNYKKIERICMSNNELF